MLIRLLPQQVSNYWDTLAPLLLEALPPGIAHSRFSMINILYNVLMGDAVVWVYMAKDGEDLVPHAILVTTINVDKMVFYRFVFLYAFVGVRKLEIEHWKELFELLQKYGKSVGARAIHSLTGDKRLAKIIERLGGHADFILLEKILE